jgi:DNA-binding response OmpR family regulator
MPYKILVVDDEQSILLAIRTLMELEGFEVQIAADGQTGLEQYRSFQPDLVLVDVMMPKLNGYEMVRQIRTDPSSLDTRIVYLTAKGMENNRREGYATGADDYIVKPYAMEELLEVVRNNLSSIKGKGF